MLHSAAIGVVWTTLLRAQAAVGSFLASLVPRAQLVPAVNPEDLHPDPKVVEAFKSDSLIFKGALRARSANEVLKVRRWGPSPAGAWPRLASPRLAFCLARACPPPGGAMRAHPHAPV